ncbi:MAG TPA: hypothetical protein VLX61_11985 [Anaerolineales bacterium]|nr:hypothetical protein [Anaerolineales bacterium]
MGEKGLTSSESPAAVAQPQTGAPSSKPDALEPTWLADGSSDKDAVLPEPILPPAIPAGGPSDEPVDDIKGDSIDEKDKPEDVM